MCEIKHQMTPTELKLLAENKRLKAALEWIAYKTDPTCDVRAIQEEAKIALVE